MRARDIPKGSDQSPRAGDAKRGQICPVERDPVRATGAILRLVSPRQTHQMFRRIHT